ncbi:MAG TPA: aminotransferase class V-fold PLP-dependent enzyme [Thermoleophilia bacterium]|nr:aminotransferase class V-fold PLP-dependent enzyme [Thermoleophilia bacterium]
MKRDQSRTPYLDALLRYRERGYTPFHTPGHKLGKGASAKLREALGAEVLAVDVAMAGGVEDTRESTALVHEAEQLAAEAWGAERAWFLVNGSTSGLHALIVALAGPGDVLVLPRNSHKAVMAGLIFSGATPRYVEPPVDDDWHIPLTMCPQKVAHALRERPHARAVLTISPNYYGIGADLPAIGGAAHAAGAAFLVDQAWGPHLRFCSHLPDDALAAGADAAVVSVHKLLSGLTQSSLLLARDGRLNLDRLASVVRMTQSTSPQVLMLVSIDAARQQMATQGELLWHHAIELAEWTRERIRVIRGLRVLGREILEKEGASSLDPTRVTVSAADIGLSGYRLETVLRDDYRIAVEMADPLNVVCNVTYGDSRDDVKRLVGALADLAARYGERPADTDAMRQAKALRLPAFTRQMLSPREAFFARSVALPVGDCAGQVSAELVTPYPPGIPVLAPGEEISEETREYLTLGAHMGLHVHGPEDPTLRTLRVVAGG